MEHYPDVDTYLDASEGWPAEIKVLRPILLSCGVGEEIKWGKPCYSHGAKNLAIMQEMKAFLALLFFKGALLEDPMEILHAQGPNSRSGRRMQFTSVEQITEQADTIRSYVAEAIDIEQAGLELGPAPEPVLVEELQSRLDNDSAFKSAFEGLTPGRQREYNLHFSSAKQAKTREARVEKYASKILDGKGFRDR